MLKVPLFFAHLITRSLGCFSITTNTNVAHSLPSSATFIYSGGFTTLANLNKTIKCNNTLYFTKICFSISLEKPTSPSMQAHKMKTVFTAESTTHGLQQSI